MEEERWSAENIARVREESLAKARETLRKKRESVKSLKQPFTVTPITSVNMEEDSEDAKLPLHIRTAEVQNRDNHIRVQQPKNGEDLSKPSTLSESLYNFGVGVFFSFCSVAVSMAIPLMVGSLRDTLFQPPSNNSNGGDRREQETTPYISAGNNNDLIFRKV